MLFGPSANHNGTRSPMFAVAGRAVRVATVLLVFAAVFGVPARGQSFSKTYQLGGPIHVSCCVNGMAYGFTPVIQDASISGNVQITSISVSDTGNIAATDPNGIAGTTWEVFVGSSSCGFPVGQQQGIISLNTYSCNAQTQLIFNTNGNFTAPAAGVFSGSYNFQTNTLTTNDIGQLITGTTATTNLTQGLFAQILLWGGDQGADLTLNNISITINGIANGNASGPFAFVGSGSSANCCLVVIDTSTNAVVASIPITGLGIPFAVAPDNSKIYIADYNNNLLDVIDTASKTLQTAISAPGQPNAAVVTPNGKFVYVGANNGNVYVISLATNSVVATIPMGFQVTWVTVTPDGSSVYAAGGGAVVAQISTATNKITTTFVVPVTAEQQTAGCCLAGPVFTPAGMTGYIEESSGAPGSVVPGTVHVYSFPGNTPTGTISVPTFPFDLVVSPDGTKLYVTSVGANNVSVINTSSNTVTATIPVGNSPQSLGFTPDGTLAYVGNVLDGTISIINTATNTVTGSLQLPLPFGIVIPATPPASQATTLVLTPPNLVFGNQVIGTSSENSSIQVTNPSGVTAVTITGITLTGPNPTDYIVSNNCPVPPAKLGTQASCFVNVAFAPLAVGTRTALVQIVDNNGTASSTQSAPLSGGATAAEPTTTAVILNFGVGTNVSQTATFNCPSNTVPCTDPNAHSLKLTVPKVLTPFSLSVTASEVSLTGANGDCESGQTENSDFDCRFVDYFPIQTLANGDVIVPQCNAYSNGNCVFYRVGDTPPPSYYQGPVTEYVAWNNVAYVPPSNYQANNPRLYDDPDDPPYDVNHQFVFDITNYYQPTGEFVGLDPGISGQTLHFNDFVVAYPGVTSGNYTFAILPPLKANKAAVFPQGSSIPISFTLAPSLPAGIAMMPPHRTGYSVLLDTNNTGCGDFSGAHQPTMTLPASQTNFVYDPQHQQYNLKLAGIYKPGNYKLLISSDLIAEQCAPFTVSK